MAHTVSHHLADLLSAWGQVEIKRMFGGMGAWRDGVFFAMVVHEEIYFKVGPEARGDYAAMGSRPFSYTTTRGGISKLKIIDGLWRVPDDVLEDPEQLIVWAQRAWMTARSKPQKPAVPYSYNRLGVKSRQWLKGIGISSHAQLMATGAIESYRQLKARYGKEISLNMLWGLYAAVNGVDPREITPDTKDHLKTLVSDKA